MTVLAAAFDSPGMVVLDSLRILLGGGGLFLAAYQVRMVRVSQTPGQRARFVAVGVALLVLSGSRLQNLGEPLVWQIVANAVVVALLGYGTWQFARHETPTQLRGDAGPHGRHGIGG